MLSWLIDRINPRPVGLTRILVGAAAAIRSLVALPILWDLTRPGTLRAPYADWWIDPTRPVVVVVLVVWFAAAILFALGWRVPITGSVLFMAIALTLSLDQQTYSNHLYLMAWLVLLLTLADSGAGLAVGGADRPIVRWPVLLLMTQASIVYGFAAVTKFNEEFMSGLTLAGVLRDGVISVPDSLLTPQILPVVATAAVFVELFLAVFLWSRQFRPVAFILGLGLHTTITLLMADTWELLVFSVEMLALYPLFLGEPRLFLATSAEAPRRTVAFIKRLDLLGLVQHSENPIPGEENEGFVLRLDGETFTGFRAIGRTLEYLVPTLWVAPLLRLPLLRSFGERRLLGQRARPTVDTAGR